MKSETPSSRRPLAWLAVGMGATLLASACCVLPLLLVLAGVAGAWLARLSVLRPVAPLCGAVAVAALAWAGYELFFRPRACATGMCRTAPSARMRWLYLACVLLAAGLLGFPLIAPWFY